MTTISVDGKDYDSETLSEASKKQITALQNIDGEIRRLQMQLGIASTARNVHVPLLKNSLAANPMAGDTIKLG